MYAEINVPDLDGIFYQMTDIHIYDPSKPMSPKPVVDAMGNYLALMKDVESVVKNGSKLSNQEYAERLTGMFTYYFDAEDYLQIFSLSTHRHFCSYNIIKTKMFKQVKVEKMDNSGEDELINALVCFNVAYTRESKINLNHHYSIDEINKLVAQGDIVLLAELYFENDHSIFKAETYHEFPLTKVYSITAFGSPYYMATISYVRKCINNAYLLHNLNKFGSTIKTSLDEIKGNPNQFSFEQDYASECFKAMKQKGQIRLLERILKETEQK